MSAACKESPLPAVLLLRAPSLIVVSGIYQPGVSGREGHVQRCFGVQNCEWIPLGHTRSCLFSFVWLNALISLPAVLSGPSGARDCSWGVCLRSHYLQAPFSSTHRSCWLMGPPRMISGAPSFRGAGEEKDVEASSSQGYRREALSFFALKRGPFLILRAWGGSGL